MAFRRLLLRQSAYPLITSINRPSTALTPTNRTAIIPTVIASIATDPTAMNTVAPDSIVTARTSNDHSRKRKRELPDERPSDHLSASDKTPNAGQGVSDDNRPNLPKMTINLKETAGVIVMISPNAAGTPAVVGTTATLNKVQSATPARTYRSSVQDRRGDESEVTRAIGLSTPTQKDNQQTPRVDSAVGLDGSGSPSLNHDEPSKARHNAKRMRTNNNGAQSTAFAPNMMWGHTAPKSMTRRDIAKTNRRYFGHLPPVPRTFQTAEQMEVVKAEESAALVEAGRLKPLLLEANKQHQQATVKHSADIAAFKKQKSDLEHIAQLNKDEAEKWKKDAEAAEHRLQQADVDRKAEAKQLNEKLAESENIRQNGAYQHLAEIEQLKSQAYATHTAVVGELRQQLFEVTQERDEIARSYVAHNAVVSELQQQLLRISQERDEIARKTVAEGSQLQLLRSLPNFWSLLREAEVLSCPIKNKLLQHSFPQRSCQGLLLPMTDLQWQESLPERMDGVEQSAIQAGITLVRSNNHPFHNQTPATVSTAATDNKGYTIAGSFDSDFVVSQNTGNKGIKGINGQSDAILNHGPCNGHPPANFGAPTGTRSQNQEVFLSANRPVANANATDRRSAQGINPSGFFSNSSHVRAVAEQTRGIKHNTHANSQSQTACKFSHINRNLVQQSIRPFPIRLQIEQPSQGPSLAPTNPRNEQTSRVPMVAPTAVNRQPKKTCYNLLEDYCDSIIEKDMPEISNPRWANDLNQLLAKCEKVPQAPTSEDMRRLRTAVRQLREWLEPIEGFPTTLAEAINAFGDMVEFFTEFEKEWEQEQGDPRSARSLIARTSLATCWTSLEDLLYNMVEPNSPTSPKWAPALEKALEACCSSKTLPTLEHLCYLEIARPYAHRWALNAKVPKELSIQLRKIDNVIEHLRATLGYDEEEEDELRMILEMRYLNMMEKRVKYRRF